MTIPSVHCEAKKHGYRQTQDGIVVSFVLHPQEVPDDLALAALGTRYMMALAQIGDDEVPIEPQKPERPGRRFDTMPLSQQAALKCSDPAFWRWASPGNLSYEGARQAILHHCQIKSRAELDGPREIPPHAGERWMEMLKEFITVGRQ